MEFKYKKKTYTYDKLKNVVLTEAGNLARDQENIIKSLRTHIEAMRRNGFNLGMGFEQFETYVAVLDESEKEELFHHIYEKYLYVGDYIANDAIPMSDYMKCLSKMKRYEHYLYIVIKS